MQINIQSVHMQASPALEQLITKKLNKVFGPYPYVQSARVFLREGSDHHKPTQEVEIEVHLSNGTLFAKEVSNRFEKSNEQVIQKLKRQLEKYKAKTYAH
ncbi:MAG: ribosome-associated translation inhibitor RaiA [Bacteroidota bacterium]